MVTNHGERLIINSLINSLCFDSFFMVFDGVLMVTAVAARCLQLLLMLLLDKGTPARRLQLILHRLQLILL